MLKTSFKVIRPLQWTKNLLVLAAPVAASEFSQNFTEVFMGMVVFIALSSFGYIMNDWKDREEDKLHHRKRYRPVASGQLGKSHLFIVSLVCLTTAVSIGATLPKTFGIVALAYLAVSISYTLFVKNIATVELVWIAVGFLLRALAGSAIIAEEPTVWFLLCVFFGSLLVVSVKRLSEHRTSVTRVTRESLSGYTESSLSAIRSTAMAATIVSFSLWAFEVNQRLLAQLSVIPMVMSILLFVDAAENRGGEEPETLFFSSKELLISTCLTVSSLLIVFMQ